MANVRLMRILVAKCEADYTGRLVAHLPFAKRVILIKADQSVLIFSELGSYKPLNWMAAPCTIRDVVPEAEELDGPEESGESEESGEPISAGGDATSAGGKTVGEDDEEQDHGTPSRILEVRAAKSSDVLVIRLYQVESDRTYDLGRDPGLTKDGVEDNLQHLLAEQIERIGKGARLVRREFPTPVGPVDIMAKDAAGQNVAIEIKRHGGIAGVEQLTRYVRFLNRDPELRPVRGIFAAQTITEQARTLAQDRGLECLLLDYDDMKQVGDTDLTLF